MRVIQIYDGGSEHLVKSGLIDLPRKFPIMAKSIIATHLQ